jgi:Spy/CpxP family protein refolding chaperone
MKASQTLVITAVLFAAISCVSERSAQAQFGAQAGIADAFRAEFMERDLPLMAESLKLEDWQRPIVEALLENYRIDFQMEVEIAREKMRAATENIDTTSQDQMMNVILEPVNRLMTRRKEIHDDFLLNVKAQLSAEQIANWPRFERTLLRDKELPMGELMGESVDLFKVTRNMRFPYEVEVSLDPVLLEYELELDGALVKRKARIKSLQEDTKNAMIEMDFEKALSLTSRIMETRIYVRNVQDLYIVKLRDVLPEEYSANFFATAMKQAYPKVYRPTSIEGLIEMVRERPDLSEDQIMQLNSIESEYQNNLGLLEEKLLNAYRTHEPKEPRRRYEAQQKRRDGERSARRNPTPMDALASERNDLVSETRRKIMAILTPEQIGSMPGSRRPTPKDTDGASKSESSPGKKSLPKLRGAGSSFKDQGKSKKTTPSKSPNN